MDRLTVGVSTASLFKRMYNEDAISYLQNAGVRVCEVFLGTFCEYRPEFAKLLNTQKGDMRIHSVHTLNTHFEPQLFSQSKRAKDDAYLILQEVLQSAKLLGARAYTFHGVARIKRKIVYSNFSRIGEDFAGICELCAKYGVLLGLENVEWAYYNHPGFFSSVREYCPNLFGTLDIKQARESGEGYEPYLKEMGDRIITVHLSDVNADGRICLPGQGVFDFEEFFKRLMGEGVACPCLIEVYKESYGELDELKNSYEYLNDILLKIK